MRVIAELCIVFLLASVLGLCLVLFIGQLERFEAQQPDPERALKLRRAAVLRQAFFSVSWHNVKYHLGWATYKMDKTPLSEMNETEYSRILRPVPAGMHYATRAPQRKVSVPVGIDWCKAGLLEEEVWDHSWLNSSSNSMVLRWALATRPVLKASLIESLVKRQFFDCIEESSFTSILDCVDAAGLRHFEQTFGEIEPVPEEKLRLRAEKKVIKLPESMESYLHKIVKQGPLMAAIHATPYFRHYKTGVFFDSNCREDKANYAVLIVGYGTDKDFGDYWLVKTTWGPDFGENGYARIARNRNNHCGIASFPYLGSNYGRAHRETASLLWNYYASENEPREQKSSLNAETLKKMEDLFWK